jgi:superfamily II DNA or RNA helicase
MKVEFNYDPKRREVKIVSEYFNNIREAFSAVNPAARFVRVKNRYIPSRFYAITAGGYCDFGLVPEIVKHLNSLDIPFEIQYNKEYTELLNLLIFKNGRFVSAPLRVLNCELELRPYQDAAIREALNTGYGTIVVGTGGGKTFIMATLLYNLNLSLGKVLIIVPDIGLVSQTYDDFISYGIPEQYITKWTGSHDIDLNKNVIIANLGILQSKKSDLSWFKYVQVLFVDECHKLRYGNEVNKLIDKVPTFTRYGFTGTLPENKIDMWNIFGRLGPVIYEKNTADLRAEGAGAYIANAQALAIEINYKNPPDYLSVSKEQKYRLELEYIHNNSFRNKIIKNIVQKLPNNCLILVDRIAHGDNLFQLLSTIENKQVYFIQGEVEVEDRKKTQQLMEEHDNVVCIAISKIFSTGISINNIHYIMFVAGGKSKIKTLQSIGRGLRLHENKDKLTIIVLLII